jgi:hypothetical protein
MLSYANANLFTTCRRQLLRKPAQPSLKLIYVDDPKSEERLTDVYRFLIDKAYSNLLRKYGLDGAKVGCYRVIPRKNQHDEK